MVEVCELANRLLTISTLKKGGQNSLDMLNNNLEKR